MWTSKIDKLPGYKNRKFREDQENLVLAIKDNEAGSLLDSFQKYWKEACHNTQDLSDFDAWIVLQNYAREMFENAEWYHVYEAMKRAFFEGKLLSARDTAEMYLVAIHLMQMRYSI